jgi:hypothetical protein
MENRNAYWREYQRKRRCQAAEALTEAKKERRVDLSEEVLRTFKTDFKAACLARGLTEPRHWRQRSSLRKRLMWERGSGPVKLVADLQRTIWRRSKARARTGKIEFDLKPEDIPLPDHCMILGLKLDYTVVGLKVLPEAPSLDRIDNSKGYVKDNIQVISHRANKLKNDGSLEELVLLGKWAGTMQTKK